MAKFRAFFYVGVIAASILLTGCQLIFDGNVKVDEQVALEEGLSDDLQQETLPGEEDIGETMVDDKDVKDNNQNHSDQNEGYADADQSEELTQPALNRPSSSSSGDLSQQEGLEERNIKSLEDRMKTFMDDSKSCLG